MNLLVGLLAFTALHPFSSLHSADGGSDPGVDTGTSILLASGESVVTLGSWERRIAGLIGYQTWKPEPKLRRVAGSHIDQFWQFYGMYHSGQDSRWDPFPTFGAGFLYGYRKNWVGQSGQGVYADLAWGFNMGDHTSHDLPSPLNSTPVVGVGFVHPFGIRFANLGVQYMHFSNAGTTKHNRGENFILGMISIPIH